MVAWEGVWPGARIEAEGRCLVVVGGEGLGCGWRGGVHFGKELRGLGRVD